jgi:hypothetical protein
LLLSTIVFFTYACSLAAHSDFEKATASIRLHEYHRDFLQDSVDTDVSEVTLTGDNDRKKIETAIRAWMVYVACKVSSYFNSIKLINVVLQLKAIHINYNVLSHNCEHFATWCRTGHWGSKQASALMKSLVDKVILPMGMSVAVVPCLTVVLCQVGPILAVLEGGIESMLKTIIEFVIKYKKEILVVLLIAALVFFGIYVLRNSG